MAKYAVHSIFEGLGKNSPIDKHPAQAYRSFKNELVFLIRNGAIMKREGGTVCGDQPDGRSYPPH
jgi:hypothetical protein